MAHKLELTPVGDWGFFTLPRPMVIAGPCSAESEEQLLETAQGLKEGGIHVFRAGIWKPRTHPGSFEGVGIPGLKWMQKVKQVTGMKICTEVASEKHVYECIKHGFDMVWIGARTSANPFLMQEIAEALRDCDMPVLVKNPVNPDLDLWMGALERLNACGVKKLGVIHRGFSTAEKIKYRNSPQWQVAVELRTKYPELPFFADPSHMGGSKEYILELSQRAMDLGFEGVMIESHSCPSKALSDASQQLTPPELSEVLASLQIRDSDSNNVSYREGIGQLRAQVDVIDDNLLHALASRFKVTRQIGQYKKAHNVAIVQANRWDAILEKAVEKAKEYDLSEEFVVKLFNLIHEESVAEQNKIVSSESED